MPPSRAATRPPACSTSACARAGAMPARSPAISCPGTASAPAAAAGRANAAAAATTSAAAATASGEQPSLLLRELFIGEHALLVQRAQLLELAHHVGGQPGGGRRRRRGRRRGGVLLLLETVDPRVLLAFRRAAVGV